MPQQPAPRTTNRTPLDAVLAAAPELAPRIEALGIDALQELLRLDAWHGAARARSTAAAARARSDLASLELELRTQGGLATPDDGSFGDRAATWLVSASRTAPIETEVDAPLIDVVRRQAVAIAQPFEPVSPAAEIAPTETPEEGSIRLETSRAGTAATGAVTKCAGAVERDRERAAVEHRVARAWGSHNPQVRALGRALTSGVDPGTLPLPALGL